MSSCYALFYEHYDCIYSDFTFYIIYFNLSLELYLFYWDNIGYSTDDI